MKSLNFFKKIELVISHPHRFFDRIKEEKNIWKVFEFYSIFVFLSLVTNLLFQAPLILKDKLTLSFPLYFLFIIISLVIVLLSVLFVGLSSFVLYYLCHIIIKIFKGKEKYKETYKLVYAATPMLIVLIIPFYGFFKIIFYPLFFIAFLDTIYIEFVALQKLQRLSKENAVAVIILSIILGILSIKLLNLWGLLKI